MSRLRPCKLKILCYLTLLLLSQLLHHFCTCSFLVIDLYFIIPAAKPYCRTCNAYRSFQEIRTNSVTAGDKIRKYSI